MANGIKLFLYEIIFSPRDRFWSEENLMFNPLDKSNTFRASRLSGTTNTVLSEEASSKMLDIDFSRQNKYFQRSTNSLTFFCSTKQILQAPLHSQTSRKPTFERWLFSLDETRNLSAMAFPGNTNTMVWTLWAIPLGKYNTFGLDERSAGGFRALKPLRVQCQTFVMNCSRARSIGFLERNRFRARRRSSIGSSKTPLLESAKRRKRLFF